MTMDGGSIFRQAYRAPLIAENLEDKNPQSDNGLTPLHIAAEEGNVEVCKFLIEEIKNKNPKLPHNGWTPLHPACKMGYFGICEVILKNVTEKSKTQCSKTPSILAAENGQLSQLYFTSNHMRIQQYQNAQRSGGKTKN